MAIRLDYQVMKIFLAWQQPSSKHIGILLLCLISFVAGWDNVLWVRLLWQKKKKKENVFVCLLRGCSITTCLPTVVCKTNWKYVPVTGRWCYYQNKYSVITAVTSIRQHSCNSSDGKKYMKMIYGRILPHSLIGMLTFPSLSLALQWLVPSLNQQEEEEARWGGGGLGGVLIEVLKTRSQLNCNCRGF